MADLGITYEDTNAAGTAIVALAEEFNTNLTKINSTNEELKNYWKGGDADSYTARITEQAQVMSNLQVTIDSIGKYLQTAASLYKQAMEENKI